MGSGVEGVCDGGIGEELGREGRWGGGGVVSAPVRGAERWFGYGVRGIKGLWRIRGICLRAVGTEPWNVQSLDLHGGRVGEGWD